MSDAGYTYINETGVIVPDTADLLAIVQAEWRAAFGTELTLDPSTPQGILITAETLARAFVLANNAAIANQINPTIAGGVFLKAICALTGLEPPEATFSVVSDVVLTGEPNLTISAGAIAKTAAQDQFELISAVTLDGSGNGVGNFQAVLAGPVPCAIGALNSIVSEVLGWETVTNPNAAVLGTDAPSDAQLRTLRANTLALQGIGLNEAIVSGLYDTPGVRSLAYRENIANTTEVIDGITLVAHSIWACVQGGTDEDVAAALLSGKSMGANWNGDVTVMVTEEASGQEYEVKFDRPDEIAVYVRVTIKSMAALINPQAAVRAAVLAYANGELSNEPGFTVGTDVSPFELAAAVNSQIPGVFVTKVEVSDDGSTWQTTEYPIALDEVAVTQAGSITVVVV